MGAGPGFRGSPLVQMGGQARRLTTGVLTVATAVALVRLRAVKPAVPADVPIRVISYPNSQHPIPQ